MTLKLTKELNWKILQCNLHANLRVRYFDMIKSGHFVYTFRFSAAQVKIYLQSRDYPGIKRVNHPYGPSTQSNPSLKLFLYIVPSSSESMTRAMRRQPKRLTRNYPRRNGGNATLYVLISFPTRALSRHFVRPYFHLSFARLAVRYFAV